MIFDIITIEHTYVDEFILPRSKLVPPFPAEAFTMHAAIGEKAMIALDPLLELSH